MLILYHSYYVREMVEDLDFAEVEWKMDMYKVSIVTLDLS